MRRRARLLFAALGAVSALALFTGAAIDRHWKRERCKDGRGVVVESCVQMNALRARWGAKRYSNQEEETLVRDFFHDKRSGFFLDVGAGEYRDHSNTYFLEEQRGWRGIAVDANSAHADGYARHRPGTRFFSVFVSDVTESSHPFFVSEAWELSADSERYVQSATSPFTGKPIAYASIVVPAITLDDLLAREHVTKIDYLTMDIEEAEPAALRGFDIRRYRPELVCIEMRAPTASFIRSYMAANRYVAVARYSGLDDVNGYFAPIDSLLLH